MSSLKGKPGYKTVPITLVLRLEEEVPEDWEDHTVQFWVEENHCMQNYVRELAKEVQDADDRGACVVCHRAEAHVGHVKVGED